MFPKMAHRTKASIGIPLLLSLSCAGLNICSGDEPTRNIPESWVEIEVSKFFSFSIPPELKEIKVKGKDSMVGRFESKTMALSYDYGWYSDSLKHYTARESYKAIETTIDGKKAKIVTLKQKTEDVALGYVAAIHFPKLPNTQSRLTMFARCAGEKELELAKRIFGTVKFKE